MYLLDLYATQLLESQVNYELRILGINFFVFYAIVAVLLCLGGFVFYLYWNHRKRELNRKQTYQQTYAEFTTPEGHIIKGLYPSHKGQLKVTIGKKNVTVNEWLETKTTDGYEIDTYYCFADFRYTDWYPEGKPRAQQVQVEKFYYKIGDPIPKMKHGTEELTKLEEMALTSQMTTQIQNENDLKLIQGGVERFIKQLTQLIEQYKWVKYMIIGVIVVVILGLAGVVLGVVNMSTVKALSSQLNAINQYIMGH